MLNRIDKSYTSITPSRLKSFPVLRLFQLKSSWDKSAIFTTPSRLVSPGTSGTGVGVGVGFGVGTGVGVTVGRGVGVGVIVGRGVDVGVGVGVELVPPVMVMVAGWRELKMSVAAVVTRFEEEANATLVAPAVVRALKTILATSLSPESAGVPPAVALVIKTWPLEAVVTALKPKSAPVSTTESYCSRVASNVTFA